MRLTGKRALVTGSSRGNGAAIARAMALEGADVVVNHRSSSQEAFSVGESITRAGRKALVIQSDISKKEEVDAMFGRIESEFGGLDILVNNAGLADGKIWNARLDEIT